MSTMSESETPPTRKSLPVSEPALAIRAPADLVARENEPPSSIRIAAQASVLPPDTDAPPPSSDAPQLAGSRPYFFFGAGGSTGCADSNRKPRGKSGLPIA
jgi:hypothetical protein